MNTQFAANNQFPTMYAPMAPSMPRAEPPKLSNHSLALLNAFKGRDEVSGSSTPSGPSFSQFLPGPSGNQMHPHHPQELPAEQLTNKTQPPRIPQPIIQPNSNPLSPRQPISAIQKSTLLDMFKSPTAQAAVPAKVLNATALPTGNTPSAVELSAVEPLSSNVTVTEDTPNFSQKVVVGESNPEINLPFGAMSILARPPGKKEREERPKETLNKYQNQASGKKFTASTISKGKGVQPVNKVFQPQILKRPQPGSSKDAQIPILPSPKLPSVAPLPVPERKVAPFSTEPASPAGHKQTLLSLFGKPSPIGPPLANAAATQQIKQANTSDTSTKSRMGGIASGEAASRRGSQTPISSADKGFLLSYLDAIVGGNQL